MLVGQLNVVYGIPKIPHQAWLGTMMLLWLETQKIGRLHQEVSFSLEETLCHGLVENKTTYHSP